MAESSLKIPGMFDHDALLAVQRRNCDAFRSAGQIVAEGMRTCAARQAALMQQAMLDLWGELQTAGPTPTANGPSDQPARMRAAFDKVLAQVQELTQLLFKVQSETMAVLNTCASANMEALGGIAPDLAGLQKMATDAMQTASHQVAAAVDEMRSGWPICRRRPDRRWAPPRRACPLGRRSKRPRTSRSPARRIRLQGLIRKAPEPQASGKGAEIPRRAAMASLGRAEEPAGEAVRTAK